MQKRRQQNLRKLQKKYSKLQKLSEVWRNRTERIQQARLVVALFWLLSMIPLAVNPHARWEYLLTALLLVVFLFLVFRTQKLVRFRSSLERYLSFCQRQVLRLEGRPSGRDWKSIHEKAALLKINSDIGLTGAHSLWTLLDETLTEAGQDRLLSWFQFKARPKSEVEEQQILLQRLRPLRWFYTKLGLTQGTQNFNATKKQLTDFIQISLVTTNFSRVLFVNLTLWSLMVLALIFHSMDIGHTTKWLFVLFPLISWASLGLTAEVFDRANGLEHLLSHLKPLFKKIEKRSQTCPELKQICSRLTESKPSNDIQKLERLLGFLGTKTNPLLHFLVNAILPWTLLSTYLTERVRIRLSKNLPTIMDELANFEAYGSLVIFDSYQTQTYPVFSGSSNIQCQKVFHPLLNQTAAVPNDFSFLNGQSLGLLTGSNMSGKSTFLRTLGLNQILANMGAPVFADSFATDIYKVETCIEVSDSLRDGYSYFYAEVRKLKDILMASRSPEPILYLIDEIFRGTNNRERQIGSRAVISQLAQSKNARGFISTHDLELTHLSEENNRIVNLHFKEDIDQNGQMHFSYLLKNGPCPTTNALRIMQSEGLI